MKHFVTYLRNHVMQVFCLALVVALTQITGNDAFALIGLTVGAAPGYPAGGSSGPSKYTPMVYAKKLLIKFYQKTVFGEIANRDYEGDISKQGDKVLIRTRPDVVTGKYTKGMDLRAKRKTYEPPNKELLIDQALFYSVALDDIDEKQMDIAALDEWARDGSEQLGIDIDEDILNTIYADADATNVGATAGAKSSSYNLGATGAPVALTKANVLDYIVYCNSVLSENNVPSYDRFMIIPEWAKACIGTSDLRNASVSGDQSNANLRNGKMGQISDFNIYASNALAGVTDGADTCFNILFGQKSALTFASQLVKNRTIELQDTFGSAMEGLHVYGYEVVKPEALGVLYAKKG